MRLIPFTLALLALAAPLGADSRSDGAFTYHTTPRELFSAMILQGFSANPRVTMEVGTGYGPSDEVLAALAVHRADALIKALYTTPPTTP